jgi:hypothetical protein
MAPANVLSDSLFDIDGTTSGRAIREQRSVDILRRITTGSPNNDLVLVLVPLEHRTRTDAELLANLSGHGNLTLSS